MFRDRYHAGELLADKLSAYAGRGDVVVLGLPRGGLPVAYEIARRIGAPLDVFIVRKLGVPGQPELALGAIASGGVRVLNDDVVGHFAADAPGIVAAVTDRETVELERRENLYRDERPPPDLTGRTIILVDDGLATGATMRAAVAALRLRDVAKLVVAVPVGAPETCLHLKEQADDVVCLDAPEYFYAVGQFYEDFSQVTDEEVRCFLAAAPGRTPDRIQVGGAPPNSLTV
jgi:predicted phosphoribosyltransferase